MGLALETPHGELMASVAEAHSTCPLLANSDGVCCNGFVMLHTV